MDDQTAIRTTDLALEVLLSVRAQIAPGLDEMLLRQCYEIQHRHQFDHDRAASYKATEHLVTSYVNRLLEAKE